MRVIFGFLVIAQLFLDRVLIDMNTQRMKSDLKLCEMIATDCSYFRFANKAGLE